jgi:hypothetical protein
MMPTRRAAVALARSVAGARPARCAAAPDLAAPDLASLDLASLDLAAPDLATLDLAALDLAALDEADPRVGLGGGAASVASPRDALTADRGRRESAVAIGRIVTRSLARI